MPKNYRKSLRQTTYTRLKPFWKREKRDEEFSIWSSGPSTAGSLNRTYKSTQYLLKVSVLRIAPSDTDSVSSWVSIYNLTVESENSTLWTALLSSFLGYPLLSPTMKTKHVYLTLPSNSSMNYFPSNTLTHYTTKLPKIMDLDGTWQIGLAEIHYPHSWYNVKNKEAWLKVHFTRSQNYKSIWSCYRMGTMPRPKGSLKPLRGKSTGRNSRINSTWVSAKSIIKSIWKWKKIVKSSSVLYYNPC